MTTYTNLSELTYSQLCHLAGMNEIQAIFYGYCRAELIKMIQH